MERCNSLVPIKFCTDSDLLDRQRTGFVSNSHDLRAISDVAADHLCLRTILLVKLQLHIVLCGYFFHRAFTISLRRP